MGDNKMIDFFGFDRKKSKKARKQQTLKENKRRGRAAEAQVKFDYQLKGYEVERTGRGHDFRVRRRNVWGKVVESKVVEVKSGNAKLSKLQNKTKKKKSNYKVERVKDPFMW